MFDSSTRRTILSRILTVLAVLAAIGLGGWLLSTPALEAATWPAPLTFISPIGDPLFSLNKTVNNPAPSQGDLIDYTLSYANVRAGSQAFNVQLYDFLPTGAQFISATVPATLDASGAVILTLPPAGPGINVNNVIVRVRVPGNTAQMTNYALITADGVTPTAASLVTQVAQPALNQLRLTKHGYAFALPSSELVYTLQATNLGSETLQDVIVVDVMPTNQPLLGVVPAPQSITWPMLRWSLGTLGPGQSATIAMTTTAPGVSGVITNSAVAGAWQNIVTQTHFSTTVLNPSAILRVNKSASASVVGVGDTLVYTLRYENAGDQTATSVWLTDTLPADIHIVALSRLADMQTAQHLAWNLGALNVGEQGQIVITATVGGTWNRNLHNVADITGGAGSTPEHFELDTTVRPALLLLPVIKKNAVR